ncbi:MAG: hypothetical protein JRJ12_11885 [Deltaproteobacteria bacterium]|nr:hypothetical protein [Deltaproteobacteria bacterium]MBW2071215.1 hypothetical protein [Deltaproteobacteria bacterium]
MNLSVEATSAYILICSLAEEGAPVSLEKVGSFWNGDQKQLTAALHELASYRIISESCNDDLVFHYLPNPANLWQRTCS